MQKKLVNILFSTRLMGLLFITYFVAMAVGTFLDRGQDTSPTPYSRVWVYNSWWFTLIHILFVINFLGNIVRFKLLRKEKITTLIFHLSFVLILIGAGITRYISFEGVMPISEGETENTFLSEKTYLEVLVQGEIDGQPMQRTLDKELMLSPRLSNTFTWNTDFNKDPIKIAFNKFIGGAEDGFIEDEAGEYHLKIVETGDSGGRHEHYLKDGELVNMHNVLYAFNKPTDGAINIGFDGENYTIRSPFEGEYKVMATQTDYPFVKDSVQPLQLRSLYNLQGLLFVIPEPAVKGRAGIVERAIKEKNEQDALFVDVTANGETKTVGLLGGKGYSNDKKLIEVGGYKMYLSYGSKSIPLPFGIKLRDFIAEKYPGTESSYASFTSKITVEDEETFDYDIYMNHVLDHKGYRFFQASFKDEERTTILSVSHDFWGTWVTYIGYFLLYLGMMLILFDKGSRFGELKKTLDKIKAKKSKLLAVILLLFAFAKAETAFSQDINTSAVVVQDTIVTLEQKEEPAISILPSDDTHSDERESAPPTKTQIDSAIVANAASAEHAAKFGRMVIQDDSGRMMPINTYASMLLRKLSRSDTYQGLNADQVMLSMMENPYIWNYVDILYLKKGNDSIRNVIGVPSDVKRFKVMDFFDDDFKYKLEPYLAQAFSEATPSVIDKEFRDVALRLGLLDRTLSKKILKILPKLNDPNNTWVSPIVANDGGYRATDSVIANQIFPAYLLSLRKAKIDGDYSDADKILEGIEKFQRRLGGDIMPSAEKIDAEILYNNNDPFTKLYWLYMLAAFFMMVFVITEIFSPSKFVSLMVKVGGVIVTILFLLHTGSLIWRWYISGHAPWSDAYESVLYVAWATMFFGLSISIQNWVATRNIYGIQKVSKFLIPFAITGAAVASLGDVLFGKKGSTLTVASTAFVTGFILWAASMNWMNPEIANLQAVLNSYWLMIHTAVIVASYGPFTLGAILGIVTLFLMIFTTKKNKAKMDLNIKELTVINEMALTVGMVLLAIGTFLGGQWANESWGRYWGWDPKETWALISLIVYAFVIHMRLIPGLRGRWLFNLFSIIALGSILFTYFGVNFYLSGLHAYQSGGDIANQKIIIGVSVIALLGFFSYRKYAKYYKKS
ncbi:cytochrome c biogenesis protein CcsA [uncultured Dokdonia sp.]|uniref:cytochrome c biogenesis protein CcsA n=1 Tax=uncultured Dokdonia sp. TaxID=575653 RepID=UPI002607546C|nr:cytochrome c biogenesis protein CcsA [uncultured Dokdonia sp.]